MSVMSLLPSDVEELQSIMRKKNRAAEKVNKQLC